MKVFFIAAFFSFFVFELFPERKLYETLLNYRLENDNSYKYLRLEALIAENNYRKAKNNSLANFILGSGDMKFTFSKEADKQGFSVTPYADLSFPFLNNTGVKVTAPYSKYGNTVNSGGGIVLSTEIYGQTRRHSLLLVRQAAEAARKADKKAANGAELTEKKLLNDIKNLFNEYVSLLDKEIDETQANINYEKVKAQGYGNASSKARASHLSLLTAGRERKQADFSFSVTYKKFLQSCGIKEELSAEEFLNNLASSVPDTEVMQVDGFTADDYVPIKDAKLLYAHNIENRALSVSPFSLAADAGYSYSKKSISNAAAEDSHLASAGLSMKLPGTKISAGVDVPLVGKSHNGTVFKLGFSFSPLEAWNYSLDRKNAAAQNQIEILELNDLINSFDMEFKTIKVKSENIKWQKKVSLEELSIYKQNDDDHKIWFSKGFASLFEKQQAELEYKKALARLVNARINCTVFNIETSSVFEKSKTEETE